MTVRAASILVVDDTVENLRLLSEMLVARGFDVRPVTSARAALTAMASDVPDLVLLDVMMPEMDGIELCKLMKESPAWRGIPVIFLTALTDVADKVRGFAAGGTDYVTKPFQLEEVAARVENQLALMDARKQLAESLDALRKVEQLRDDLVHMIVHDMRAPLSVLLMNLELVQSMATGEVSERVADAITGGRELCRMANTLLDVSRLEAGRMPLAREPVDLSRLLFEVREALAPLAPARTIEIAPGGAVVACCDGGLIRRVLENLVSNGIRHTPAAGRLKLGVAAAEGRARIVVQDEGPGVPPEARDRIFEKFGASALRRAGAYHSAGLGLAYCKLAVQAHGGSIGVESEPARGSAFWFELPL